MVERRPLLNFFTHAFLIIGLLLIFLPIYIAFDAATHSSGALLHAPIPLIPGHLFFHNLYRVLFHGFSGISGQPIWPMMINSFIMAMCISVGKISVSLLSAFAIVYFRFPLRKTVFWLIFITLMLPIQVRILPTFQVVADLHMLNSYSGLTLPLLASATATFLFRQFFMTIPDELLEAARIDGAGPMRFFWDILIPLSRTNIAALFVIMFIYGWNQYLWPLVVTTQARMDTVVMGIQQIAQVADQIPQWNDVMATAILAMLPPLIVVLLMQRFFVKGLVDSEK